MALQRSARPTNENTGRRLEMSIIFFDRNGWGTIRLIGMDGKLNMTSMAAE
jgi:hypothetical protein